ncbi:MAG: GNAT family N-acetyltransferase, partial [Candidatus Latescibacteria bacterium]|nr:GNAT family N-acetyltransferase [Candidatus Latescibacterota bacterium]
MITIPPEKRHILAPLFKNHKRQRVIIDAALEQPYGEAVADSEHNPKIARLHLGVFTLFGGEPHHPGANELIQTCHRGLLIAETNAWRDKILVIHKEHGSTYRRYGFSLNSLNLTHVQTLAKNIPENYHILQVDES